MYTQLSHHQRRSSRVRRIRAKIYGTASRPRLSLYRSLTTLRVQLIDDTTGHTLLSADDRQLTGTPMEKARQLGALIADQAKKKAIKQIVFDRSGYQYHGRVAAIAEGARSQDLQF